MKKIFTLLLSGASFCILRGYILSIIWIWFVVPLGIPQIGIAHAIGLSGLVSLLTKNLTENVNKDETKNAAIEDALSRIVSSTITLAAFLGFTWFTHLFM